MPQKSIITPILGNEYYHIFNRGNNGCRLFFNEYNYYLFLKMYREFVSPYCETLSYCLIANHFHLLIKTNASIFIIPDEFTLQLNPHDIFNPQTPNCQKTLINHYRWDDPVILTNKPNTDCTRIGNATFFEDASTEGYQITDKVAVGHFISEQLRRLFLQYAIIIKKQENIKGSLFVKPFRRLMIENQDYLEQVIFYIHTNPAKHEVHQDYKTYRFSSYRHFQSDKTTFVAKDHVLSLFGGLENFETFHEYRWEERKALLIANINAEVNNRDSPNFNSNL